MVTKPKKAQHREPLSRDRVLDAAVALADEGGLEALTMRGLAETLDVEAMSLYYHVANKEALLDGVAEAVVTEVNLAVEQLPAATGATDWRAVARARILAARQVMLRHKWAPALLETRTTMSLPVLVYYHGLLEVFRAGGLSYDLIHHSLHALGSRAMGFTQEMFDPAPGSTEEEDQATEVLAQMASQIPLLVEMLSEVAHDDPETNLGWCDDQTEFEFALDILLDGIERLARAEQVDS
ncbi:MAG TPA: TetR/AcrR family transcriptional regulator C-terminal domain-containing protein [Acidimicrobiia bacterium]|nr:TetR/AcrR family transcriptional regulator C-terminal domain-containing protein [Acidimicrobiia bacterium]